MDIQEKIEKLKSFSIFKNINDKQIGLIAEKVVDKKYSKGEIIIEQDDDSKDMYFILSGLVKVYVLNEEGKEINIALIGTGETIGELAVITGETRSATCEAQSDIDTFVLSSNNLNNLLKNSTEISMAFLKDFAEKLVQSNKHLENTVSLNLKERALILLRSLSKYATNNLLDISQEELSEILSATRPRVSEALQELAKEGKIALKHRNIEIL